MAMKLVRWGIPAMSFELRTCYQAAFEHARIVLGPHFSAAPPTFCWNLEMSSNKTSWRLIQTESGCTEVDKASLEKAVRVAEHSALLQLIEREEVAGVSVHGAILQRGKDVIALVGESESGKSTLACALWKNGWTLHCDDGFFLAEVPIVVPAPRRVALRASSYPLLGEEFVAQIRCTPSCEATEKGLFFHPAEVVPYHEAQCEYSQVLSPLPLTSIFLLKACDEAFSPRRLNAMQGAIAVLAQSGARRHGLAAGLPYVRALAECVPVYEMSRAPLEAMLQSLEDCL